MNLEKYLTEDKNRVSVLKNVPVEHLKEVQIKVGSMVRVMNHYSSICKTKVRYEFQGPSRTKADAKTVSVYFNVRTTCPGLSVGVEKIFRETLKNNFKEMIKT